MFMAMQNMQLFFWGGGRKEPGLVIAHLFFQRSEGIFVDIIAGDNHQISHPAYGIPARILLTLVLGNEKLLSIRK